MQNHVIIQVVVKRTVMRIIKLKLFPVPLRLHSGSGKLIFIIIYRVTQRLTRLQTMRNVLKYSKIVQNGSVRLRFGCGSVAVNFSIYLCSAL